MQTLPEKGGPICRGLILTQQMFAEYLQYATEFRGHAPAPKPGCRMGEALDP